MTNNKEGWRERYWSGYASRGLDGKPSKTDTNNFRMEAFIASELDTVGGEERERILKSLADNELEYCRQQNGRDECKNCGLDIEELRNRLTQQK